MNLDEIKVQNVLQAGLINEKEELIYSLLYNIFKGEKCYFFTIINVLQILGLWK